ncbi:MAG: aminotransferase class I/II-fold pyridoxal phosphate-dependent enzyme [Rickettsiaceae bacterium H1]|nr:aminotransferase class I/II-fold pyridoxal phosphate-dependent enzyme [Rickettsiaceae bacterium H1]
MLLEQYVLNELHRLENQSLLKKIISTQKIGNSIIYHNSKSYISFSCNDSFCLTMNAIVKQSAIAAIQKYGLGSGASRLITGNNELYKILEEKLAKHTKQEAATVFSSGYMANLGTISALMSRYDLILADKCIHASIIDGAKLSKAKFIRFKHNSPDSCEDILKQNRHLHRHCLILVDHVYSMNGDVAPIEKMVNLSKKYNSWLMVDDAHGFGIIEMKHKPDIYLGTLSKALGSFGGYIASSRSIIEYLHNKARTLIYTTALPSSLIAGAIVAIDIVKKSFGKPVEKAKIFCKELGMLEPKSNIVILSLVGKTESTIQKKMLQEGFLVRTIKSPTVPFPVLRFVFTIEHKESDIKRLCQILKTFGY